MASFQTFILCLQYLKECFHAQGDFTPVFFIPVSIIACIIKTLLLSLSYTKGPERRGNNLMVIQKTSPQWRHGTPTVPHFNC